MEFQPKVLPYAYEIKTIDSHTMGESTRIVYDGFPYLPGDPDSKQIMIDSSMLGVRGTAEILAEIVQRRFGL